MLTKFRHASILLISFLGGNLLTTTAKTSCYLKYYEKVNEADLLSFRGKYKAANKEYRKAFNLVDIPHGWDLREAARNAAKMKDTSLAFFYYQKAAELGFVLEYMIETQDSLVLQSRVTKIKVKSYNSYLCAIVDSLYQQDQLYRRSDYDSNWEKQMAIDSTNLIMAHQIRKQLGKFPGVRELGHTRAQQFLLIFNHCHPKDMFDSTYRFLLKQVIAGDFDPKTVCGAIDYKAMEDADSPYAFTRVIFGCALTYCSKEKTYVYLPVRNYKCLNKLRQMVGLPTLEQQLLLSEDKTVYDEELVRRNYPKLFMETPPRKPFIDCEGKWMKHDTNN